MGVKIRQASGDAGEELWIFHCPGCKYGHAFRTKGKSPLWTFNGSETAPTFRASLLYTKELGAKYRCHTFVTDGNIQFLNDCDHDLAGKTIPIPDWDE